MLMNFIHGIRLGIAAASILSTVCSFDAATRE
jgi:hypothetical protein